MGDWKKEIARDIVALGSIPFFVIVFVRLLVGQNLRPFYDTIYYFIIIGLLLLALSLIIKHPNYYIARGLAVVIFTSIRYHDLYFTLFASLLWILMIASLIYLKEKKTNIVRGIIIGAISTSVSYYLVNFIVPLLNLPSG